MVDKATPGEGVSIKKRMDKRLKGFLRDLVSMEKKPVRGLLVVEWVVMGYLTLTLLLITFLYTKLPEAPALVAGRVRVVAMTAALWLVYRLWPCRLTRLFRITGQMSLLGVWYPDIYEINRVLPNLDHVFAQLEQSLFGCQPALLFHQWLSSPWWSEAFDMGYFSYYPMIALTVLYYFFCRPREFERAATVVMVSFFLFYLIFIFVPVVGPTFYYRAVGLSSVQAGIFPNLHDYFCTHTACLPSPGDPSGLFYQLVEQAKDAGERPVAAFPSSHVGISTVCMLLLWHARNYRLLLCLAPFYVLLCCATVYIQAHYLVDAVVGLPTGALFFALTLWATRGMQEPSSARR